MIEEGSFMFAVSSSNGLDSFDFGEGFQRIFLIFLLEINGLSFFNHFLLAFEHLQ
jgi:hypothetical protein